MKIKHAFYFILLSCLVLTSCNAVQQENEPNPKETRENVRVYSVQSVLWQQNAAEYRALCYQAFNLAKMQLDKRLNEKSSHSKKGVIITDIDETVLNNSPFNAKLIELNEEYSSDEWANWVRQESAKAVPGAVPFLNYAKERGVEIFYVSNRPKALQDATIANMKKLNFPFADANHLLLKENTSAKKGRFQKVREKHEVLLYLGDNLGDFTSKFRVSSTQKRNRLADSLSKFFGKRFIVLPNPMYGDWESKGIYKGRHDWTEAQKDSLRKTNLRAY